MNEEIELIMPQELGNNLLLRWGRPEDADALAEFNICLHSDHPPQREEWLGALTRDLMSGCHPTTSAADFTIVEELSTGAIVSSQVLIPQTWSYDGISFGVGRPELIGTDEAYRRRGLVRKQMAAAHALSAQKGHMVQAITGIPWFYRMFGYEMALNLGGGREFFWARPGNDKVVKNEFYQMRPATMADLDVLQQLYKLHCANSLIMRERTEEEWRYELEIADRDSIAALPAHIIGDKIGRVVAYVVFYQEGSAFQLRELGVIPGCSWRSVALFITRELKRRADELNLKREKPISKISIYLDDNHQLIEALGRQLEKRRNPYAWYIRVPDLQGFVRHIRPVLEKRLAGSVVAGHTGVLRLNFYQDNLQFSFKNGAIREIGRYQPKDVEDADAMFPDLTFLQLLFGYRSYDELDKAFADCYTENAEAAILLDVLFPKRPSYVVSLN